MGHYARGDFKSRLLRRLSAYTVITLVALLSALPTAAASPARVRVPPGFANTACSLSRSSDLITHGLAKLKIAETPAAQTRVADGISGLYSLACESPTIASLLGNWGVENSTLDLYGSGDSGVMFANLSVNWATWTNGAEIVHEEYLSENLRSNSFAGPFTSSTLAMGKFGGSTVSENWAGWEFQGASSATQLFEANAWTKTVSMSQALSQQVDPPDTSADSAAAVWTGLAPQQKGLGNLLQTGYAYDASASGASWCAGFSGSCDYGLWWEYLPNPPYPYSGHPTVHVGDILEEDNAVVQWPDTYMSDIYDVTTTQQWTNTQTIPSWTPLYATYIVEAPFIPSGTFVYLSQIADFGGHPINFEDGYICTAYACPLGTQVWLSTAYGNNWYDTYQLSQAPGAANTNQNYVSGSKDYWGKSASYPQVAWSTSEYNYCDLNPGLPRCQPGGGGCVGYGTPILTPNGYVPVQQLRPGDIVEEFNFSSLHLTRGSLVSANSTPASQLIDVNRGLLYLTPTDQPIYIQNRTFLGWLNDPRNLTVVDSIFDPITLSWIPVTNVTLLDHKGTVYDVVTSGFNNFVADGALLDIKT